MNRMMVDAFRDELTKIGADTKKKEKHEKPGVGATLGALLLGGPGAALGLHKGAPHGEAGMGALRGGLGAGGGGVAGSLLGHGIGRALSHGNPDAALAGQTLGNIAGQVGGYKLLTHKYDQA